ncbi:LysR family transcriptional regulator [Rivibacter subsaxonicus]|uniref:DNA-binding transcriptional LysR family regulator n=1 Tax=Rivibacter subsaxonicus TaxID=457575 RepID=A0A4Q7W1N0_9BURK|nr:LysR family transcriptional regulator [Rivibacter subsaxonicus]RZU02933.1 DNA-binding transcriptional LysR family regulator [Rivibacter subsaxonicus]
MRLNQLDGLLAFWKVAQHRGFSAAAAALEVSPSALSQAIRTLEARLGVRLLNRTTRSVSLTEAGEAYLSRIGPALGDVLEAGEQLHALQGRPSGVLRINAARISVAMVLQPLLAGFLKAHPDVQVELSNDEGYVDIVERGFDAGVRLGESVQKDMVAVPLGGPVSVAIVGSPDYFRRHPAPQHPSDLVHHRCVRFRFTGSGAIHKWELKVDDRIVDYEIAGSLTISDSLFSAEAALDGIGLAYTFEPLARPHLRSKRLKQVLAEFSPTFPGFYLYYPSRRQQPSKLKAFVDYALANARES